MTFQGTPTTAGRGVAQKRLVYDAQTRGRDPLDLRLTAQTLKEGGQACPARVSRCLIPPTLLFREPRGSGIHLSSQDKKQQTFSRKSGGGHRCGWPKSSHSWRSYQFGGPIRPGRNTATLHSAWRARRSVSGRRSAWRRWTIPELGGPDGGVARLNGRPRRGFEQRRGLRGLAASRSHVRAVRIRPQLASAAAFLLGAGARAADSWHGVASAGAGPVGRALGFTRLSWSCFSLLRLQARRSRVSTLRTGEAVQPQPGWFGVQPLALGNLKLEKKKKNKTPSVFCLALQNLQQWLACKTKHLWGVAFT